MLDGNSVTEALRIFGDVVFDPFERSGSQRPEEIDAAKTAFTFDRKIWGWFGIQRMLLFLSTRFRLTATVVG
jgi:hypothetical protein